MAISIILADDHPVVHRGVYAVLAREPDFSIVGVAADGLETVRLTERLKPEILVLDLMMPGLSGLEALRILREPLTTDSNCDPVHAQQQRFYRPGTPERGSWICPQGTAPRRTWSAP